MARLADIEGIGNSYATKLKKAGVGSQGSLLKTGSTKKGRKQISAESGVSEKLVLNWVNKADLARIKGVAGQYGELLEAAGVDTVPELATRNAENLHAKMAETNAKKKLVRQLPSAKQVAGWVAQAKKLKRVVEY
jgi:predicted flap endonuclease-1-like 5' DNA nuclease